MFKLNAEKDEFKARANSVFDSLSTLEESHNAKASDYIDKSLDTYDPEAAVAVPAAFDETSARSSRAQKRSADDGVFKVPSVPPPRQDSSSPWSKRPRPSPPPAHVLNPHKWKRYSLEDVKVCMLKN